MTEAHPLRCETCKKGYCFNRAVPEHRTFTEVRGCASHSSAKESSDKMDELEQWHYDEINRFKLKRPSVISYLPMIKAHERSIKRISELRTKER